MKLSETMPTSSVKKKHFLNGPFQSLFQIQSDVHGPERSVIFKQENTLTVEIQ